MPPVFNHDLGLLQCVEDLAVEQFVTQFTVEAFAIAVLPWASRFDVSGLGSDRSNPIPESLSDKLRAVVGTYMRRNAPRDEQLAQGLDDVGGLEFPCHTDSQALSGELVENAQHPEGFAIVGTVSDEVIRPDMIRPLRPQTDA